MALSWEEFLQEIDRIGLDIESDIKAGMDAMINDIKSGKTPQQALRDYAARYPDDVAKHIARGMSVLAGSSISVDEIKDHRIGKVTLSKRLYQDAIMTSAATEEIIKRHVKGYHQARKLTLEIYEGYDFDGQDVLTWRNDDQRMPRYMRQAISSDPESFQKWKRIARQAAGNLKTAELRSAYMEALDALETEEGRTYLNKKIRAVHEERLRYHAKRIAHTELARMHNEEVADEVLDDPEIKYIKIRLSKYHPEPDICDVYATQNRYGLGPGWYPKEHAPRPPYHPFCRCGMLSKRHAYHPLKNPDPDSEKKVVMQAIKEDGDEIRAARIAGSRAKLEQMKQGVSIASLHNSGRPDQYKIRTLGQHNVSDIESPTQKTKKKAAKKSGALPKKQAAPAEKYPAFEDQKTISSLNKWLVNKGYTPYADFSGIAVEAANQYARSLTDNIRRFPELGKKVKFMGSCQAQNKRYTDIMVERKVADWRQRRDDGTLHFGDPDTEAKARRLWSRIYRQKKVAYNTWAWSWTQEDVYGLGINKIRFNKKDWPEMRDRAFKHNVETKYHPEGTASLKASGDHEIGHQLDELLGLNRDQEIVDLWSDFSQQAPRFKRETLSAYATTNIKEFIAEAWSEYLNNPTPRQLSAKVGAIIERRYRDKYGA